MWKAYNYYNLISILVISRLPHAHGPGRPANISGPGINWNATGIINNVRNLKLHISWPIIMNSISTLFLSFSDPPMFPRSPGKNENDPTNETTKECVIEKFLRWKYDCCLAERIRKRICCVTAIIVRHNLNFLTTMQCWQYYSTYYQIKSGVWHFCQTRQIVKQWT